jgi:hypothetical protein
VTSEMSLRLALSHLCSVSVGESDVTSDFWVLRPIWVGWNERRKKALA